VLGLLFGIADWYFIKLLMWLISIVHYNIFVDVLGFAANWAIWLVPAIPVAIYQVRRLPTPIFSALAVMIVWMSAIVAYYLYYAFLLAFVGLPQMESLLVFGPHSELFWSAWSPVFQTLILGQILEWSSIALIGGSLIGWSVATFYLRFCNQSVHPSTP
jgi:hypothetical protein